MEAAIRGTLSAIAGQLAVIVGVFHLGLGTYYAVGGSRAVAGDVRVVVWSLAGATLIGGVAVAAIGWDRHRLSMLGLVVTGALVTSYLFWPAFAGEAFYMGPAPRVTLADPPSYASALVFEAGTVAKIALATELALLAVLTALIRGKERP